MNLTKEDLSHPYLTTLNDSKDLKIGLEIEVMGFYERNHKRIEYQTIKEILRFFLERKKGEPLFEKENIIAIKNGIESITLEPGGQMELSTDIFTKIDDMVLSIEEFRETMNYMGKKLGVFFLLFGRDPITRNPKIPRMPKNRYIMMERYLPMHGVSVKEMMFATCGAQSNFDYSNEADMKKKFEVLNAISIFLSALFANSAILEGRVTSSPGNRLNAWLGIQKVRTGYVFTKNSQNRVYSDYIDYALNVPMVFIIRNNEYIGMNNMCFMEFMDKGYDGYMATMDDWINHLSLFFPFIRIKNTLEIRSIDMGPLQAGYSQIAFLKGILYHSESLEKTYNRVNQYEPQALMEIKDLTPSKGLEVEIDGLKVKEELEFMLKTAEEGLNNIAPEEVKYLEKSKELLISGSLGENIINRYGVGYMSLEKILQENKELYL